MEDKGRIFVEQAYALGKMLDHSSWQKGDRKLPRRITASDVDIPAVSAVFDNAGAMIFCELTRASLGWHELSYGQRLLYENLIKGTRHCAVLCCHGIGPEQQRAIDSRHDIASFEVMLDDFGIVKLSRIQTNERWQRFVFAWMETKDGPATIRRRIIGRSAGMIKAPTNVVPIK